MLDVEVGRDRYVIECRDLQAVFDTLLESGYSLIGPTVSGAAIVYGEIKRLADLPVGITTDQDAGEYRLKSRDDALLFGFTPGPDTWKRFLSPPRRRLWSARAEGTTLAFESAAEAPERLALVGVRPCDLHAIRIQDEVHLKGAFTDPQYRSRRDALFIIAVQCTEPGGTCFCASMGTGPDAPSGYDLALTEINDSAGHEFVVQIGSDAGRDVLSRVPHRVATDREAHDASRRVAAAAHRMGRRLETDGLKEILYASINHPRWDEVAKRCLACANCTMVCPTCFCMTVEDSTNLSGEHAERQCRWDSCFTMDFSYIHGGSVRASNRSRYRQWMTHKLATWVDQFGSSGCVGCGRCITWCPAGIDLTEEAHAIRSTSGASVPNGRKEPGT